MDPSNAVISAAGIVLTKRIPEPARRTDTDSAGHYQFSALPPGQYEIHAAKTGFTEEVRTGVHLVVGQRRDGGFESAGWAIEPAGHGQCATRRW